MINQELKIVLPASDDRYDQVVIDEEKGSLPAIELTNSPQLQEAIDAMPLPRPRDSQFEQQRKAQLAILLAKRRQAEEHLHSRRHFLKLLGGTTLALSLGITGFLKLPQFRNQREDVVRFLEYEVVEEAGFGPQIEAQVTAWEEAETTPVNQFIINHKENLEKLRGGDTFIPEDLFPTGIDLLSYVETPDGQAAQQRALQILQVMVDDLGLAPRIGLRWANTIARSDLADGTFAGGFSFNFYKPYLDYLTTYKNAATGKGVDFLVTSGPYKSPGYPETFLPPVVTNGQLVDTTYIPTGQLPDVGAEIMPHMPGTDLCEKAKVWYKQLLTYLRVNYPAIPNFQGDNEPRNKAGELQWLIHPETEEELFKILVEQWPSVGRIPLNWTGLADIDNSIDYKNMATISNIAHGIDTFTHTSVITKMVNLRNKLQGSLKGRGEVVLGIDFYQMTEYAPFPVTVRRGNKNYTVWIDTRSAIEVAEKYAGHPSPWPYINQAGIPIEITEAQFERWGNMLAPGNDPTHAKYVLLRQFDILPTDKISTIRFWKSQDIIYNLLFNRSQFADENNPIKMDGPYKFIANHREILHLIAATTGRSKVRMAHGKQYVDNSRVDGLIDRFPLARSRFVT